MSGNRDRLKSQIAAHAGITVQQLETLPQLDRDQIINAHSKATMQQFALRLLDYRRQLEPDKSERDSALSPHGPQHLRSARSRQTVSSSPSPSE
jgi:hypothetical protein